jgi:hypothetical protein
MSKGQSIAIQLKLFWPKCHIPAVLARCFWIGGLLCAHFHGRLHRFVATRRARLTARTSHGRISIRLCCRISGQPQSSEPAFMSFSFHCAAGGQSGRWRPGIATFAIWIDSHNLDRRVAPLRTAAAWRDLPPWLLIIPPGHVGNRSRGEVV